MLISFMMKWFVISEFVCIICLNIQFNSTFYTDSNDVLISKIQCCIRDLILDSQHIVNF